MNFKKDVLASFMILFILIATIPVFFSIYRTIAFDTIPHDDYAPYLLAMVGEDIGNIPIAPFVYRALSVVVAIPFYYLLPAYQFSNLQGADPVFMKAIAAISFSSYLWLILTPIVIYLIARREYASSKASATIIAFASFIINGFIMKIGIDPFAIFIISVMLLYMKKPHVFIPLMILSIGINEKISIIFASILTLRFIGSWISKKEFKLKKQLIASYIAFIGYFVMIFTLAIPGNDSQLVPSLFWKHIMLSIGYMLSVKGLILIILPLVVLLFIILLAIKDRKYSGFVITDISALLVLFLLSMIANVDYNLGRVIMYSYPFYIVAIGHSIEEVLKDEK